MDNSDIQNQQQQGVDTNLRIVFWNCRSAYRKKNDIIKMLQSVDILILVETWLNYLISHNDFNFSGFNVIRRDRPNGRGGGIAFIIRKNIAYHTNNNLLTTFNDFELYSIKLTNFHNPITIIAAYKPPDLYFTQDNWDNLVINFN